MKATDLTEVIAVAVAGRRNLQGNSSLITEVATSVSTLAYNYRVTVLQL